MHINFKNKGSKKAYIRFVSHCKWRGNCPNYKMRQYAQKHDISEDEMMEIYTKTSKRLFGNTATKKSKIQEVLEILNYFNEIPYEYKGDGMDDFNKYQRPCSNGIGYVAICPGERGNNYYTENPTAVKILKRKYLDWVNKDTDPF